MNNYQKNNQKKDVYKRQALTQITEKGTDQIYNYVKQPQAAKLSQEMYNSNKFTSDLMNSYAWDTACLLYTSCDLAAISVKVEEMVKEGSKIKSMIIFNPAGKMIGGVDFSEDEKSRAKIKVYLRDQQLIDWKGKKIIPVIKRLEEETLIYDELWAIDQEGELTKIS